MGKKCKTPFRVLVGLDDQRVGSKMKYPFDTLNPGDGFDVFLVRNEDWKSTATKLDAAGKRFNRRILGAMIFEVERYPDRLRVVRRA